MANWIRQGYHHMRPFGLGTVIDAKPTTKSNCLRLHRGQSGEALNKAKVSVPFHLPSGPDGARSPTPHHLDFLSCHSSAPVAETTTRRPAARMHAAVGGGAVTTTASLTMPSHTTILGPGHRVVELKPQH